MSVRPRKSLLSSDLQRPSALSSIPRDLNYLWLDKNENLDPVLLDVSNKVLSDMSILALSTYPEAGELYRKLADWIGVSPESLILTPGSDGAIRLVFEAFVEAGDSVIHTVPTFAMYPVYSQMFGAKIYPVEYQRSDKGPYLNPQVIIKAIYKYQPKLFCLPNPDSPTGTILSPDVLKDILQVCEDNGTVFLLDEAYHPFYEWTGVPWTETFRNLIVARTFSKAWGVSGLRIGYAVAHPDTINLLHKMRPMYEVSTFSIEFMTRMLDKSSEMIKSVDRINEGKAFFIKKMQTMNFHVLPTYGNFLHVDFGGYAQAIHEALSNKVYYRQSFTQDCLSGYSRFTVAPKPIMEQVVNLIKQVTLEINL